MSHTLRGTIPGNETKMVLDDDLPGQGWIIEEFHVFPNDMDLRGDVSGVLMTQDSGSSQFAGFGNNYRIAWATVQNSNHHVVIDPNHIITNELYVRNMDANSLGYMIVMCKRQLTADESIIAMIKERSQDDL